MLNVFLSTLNAVAPIILLIVLGYVLRRINFLNDNFIKTGNKLVFNVLLPCMLFINVYDSMDGFSEIRWGIVIYCLAVICVIFALGILTAVLTTDKHERRGVIAQCTFRSNFAIIGLSLVERLGGNSAIAGIVSAFSIPLFNILAVIVLSVFVKDQPCEEAKKPNIRKTKYGVKSVILNILKNPLIVAVAAAFLCVAIREIQRALIGEVVFRLDTQLNFLYTAVKNLKYVASPFALIVLGGQFKFSAAKGRTKEIVVGVLWRNLLAPLIGIGGAVLLNTLGILSVDANVYPTLIALFASPVAVSSAVMAGEMNNDEQLATQLVVYTTVFSVLTVFISVFLLLAMGLISI